MLPTALGHLLAGVADHAVVHPDAGERQAGRLGLGDLVLVVREDEVAAAAVDVEAGAQVAQAHGRALDVPARAPHPPGALPRGLARLGRLPDGEVERVLLVGLALDPGAGLELLDPLPGEAAVGREAAHPEVDAAPGLVRVSLAHQLAHQVDDLRDGGRRQRLGVGPEPVAEPPHVLVVGGGELGRHVGRRAVLGVRLVDDLVVDVGDVLDQRHLVAALPQPAAQHREGDVGTRVADVDQVVHRGPAGVDADPALVARDELLLALGERVEQADHGFSFDGGESRTGPATAASMRVTVSARSRAAST